MHPITPERCEDLIRSCRRAWHLELRDSYHVEQEDVPFAQWLRGDPDDLQWLQGWLSFVREVTANGVDVQRLRVVTEPHSDYTRWCLELARLNTEAGEEVRYLPRSRTREVPLPEEDCWLLDEDTLILSLFRPDGRSGGFAVSGEAELTTRYRTVRDRLWPQAIPYREYRLR